MFPPASLSEVESTTAKVLSPLRNVVASLVPEAPRRAIGTVPEPSSEAFRLVMLAPLPVTGPTNDAACTAPERFRACWLTNLDPS